VKELYVFASEEEALAHVDRGVAEAQGRAVRAQALSADLDGLRVSGRSRDGAAEVTLTHTGAVVDVHLGRRLENAGLDQIRAAILEANTAAQGELSAQVTQLTMRALGESSAAAREISEQYRQMFPPVDGGPSDHGVLR
jgi:hypothetical protein